MKKTKKAAAAGKRIAMEAGAGVLTAAVLAAAGAFLLSGKEGKKRRTKMRAWAAKAQKEVGRNVKTARRMGESEYKRIVDAAVKHYGSLQNANGPEIAKVARDIKAEWKQIRANAKKMAAMMQKRGKAPAAKRPVRRKAKKIR